jgi:hypothetical protein
MKDDRQVGVLIVNYHVQEENEEPLIELTMAPMGDFLEDLQLYETLRSGTEFAEDDGDYSYDAEDLFENSSRFDVNDLEEALERLTSYREMIREWEEAEELKGIERHYLREVQSAFMRADNINPHDLVVMYHTFESRKRDILDTILDHHRKLIMSAPFSPLRSTGLPTKKGESEQFKETIRAMVNKYKQRYPILVPLLINMKLTILYVPPKEQEIDLDNLARHIVPMVNEALKPPTGIWFDVDARPKGHPKHSIIQYQIIKLPRSELDPENGVARLVLGEYEPYNNLWRDIDRLIHTCDFDAYGKSHFIKRKISFVAIKTLFSPYFQSHL